MDQTGRTQGKCRPNFRLSGRNESHSEAQRNCVYSLDFLHCLFILFYSVSLAICSFLCIDLFLLLDFLLLIFFSARLSLPLSLFLFLFFTLLTSSSPRFLEFVTCFGFPLVCFTSFSFSKCFLSFRIRLFLARASPEVPKSPVCPVS